MHTVGSSGSFSLRPATRADDAIIRRIIYQVGINPMGLKWQRFVLAVDDYGMVIGCGQIKSHRDGSIELASIAVLPTWRGKGVARKIIEHLLWQNHARLYLTCRSQLAPMYQKFGFQAVQPAEMSPYFRRLHWLVSRVSRMLHQPDNMLVMMRD